MLERKLSGADLTNDPAQEAPPRIRSRKHCGGGGGRAANERIEALARLEARAAVALGRAPAGPVAEERRKTVHVPAESKDYESIAQAGSSAMERLQGLWTHMEKEFEKARTALEAEHAAQQAKLDATQCILDGVTRDCRDRQRALQADRRALEEKKKDRMQRWLALAKTADSDKEYVEDDRVDGDIGSVDIVSHEKLFMFGAEMDD
eukprot:gnl/TRDRNA2_/TRDRNA2_184883_c0_seq1.p1 gnl/TRDRNA2_/TRDRNA2_184883_c0~~gnl/TRDRNA2_/TRDRNA2_184883_c0_seq1.p1  ORF type:complete len:206 (+),score=45.91 gnl/TRDRNA2_/TRDRNA2_184883_c0_seq1:321-938(+)